METRRLFHEDPALARFRARIIEQGEVTGRFFAVLDQTAFYPASGGQPHDTGFIEGKRVLETVEESPWGRIRHWLDGPLPADGMVEGIVDWPRRFDHMQQHTGQHLLSRALILTMNAPTVGFHLGEREVTVDIEAPSLSESQIDEVEDILARVIREDRPIAARWVALSEMPPGVETPEEAARLGSVRLVEVEGFSSDPCCGTHCRRTGEVSSILILGSERAGRRTRVSFLCGERARAEIRARMRWTSALARRMSTNPGELPAAFDRIAQEAKELRRDRSELIRRLAAHEAAGVVASPGERFDLVVLDLGAREAEEALAFSQALRHRPRVAVLLAWKDREGARVLACRSGDLDLDVRPAVAAACAVLGGRGGGRPDSAQGGGPRVDLVAEALAAMRSALTD